MIKPRRRQAGEGTISEYQTKAGPRYLIKYKNPHDEGPEWIVRRGFPTRKAAADKLGDVNSEIRRGAHVVPRSMTFGQFARTHLDGLRLAPATIASYRKMVRLHVLPKLADVQLTNLTGTQLSALYRSLERTDQNRAGRLSASSVRFVHVIVKSMLSEAVRQGLLVANPADRAKPPAPREAKAREMTTWSGPQLASFLSWADDQQCPDATAWRVLAYTGMRRGELLALRWRDFDPEAGRLSVRRSVGNVHNKGEAVQKIEGPTKSGRDRVVDLDPLTVETLRRWRVARAGLSLNLARDNALIFSDLEGGYLHPGGFTRRFSTAVTRCARGLGGGFPQIRLHDVRHTHASVLLAAGVPIKVVSERLGHASVTITMDTYAHVLPGMQAEAAARFAAIIGGSS